MIDGKLQASEIQDEFHRLFVSDFYVSWGERFLSSTRTVLIPVNRPRPVVTCDAKPRNTGVSGIVGAWAIWGKRVEPPGMNLESNGLVVRGR